jgi:hypothetical protein
MEHTGSTEVDNKRLDELGRKARGWDRIAVLLGASDDWDGGADFLDDIMNIVRDTHPDGLDVDDVDEMRAFAKSVHLRPTDHYRDRAFEDGESWPPKF